MLISCPEHVTLAHQLHQVQQLLLPNEMMQSNMLLEPCIVCQEAKVSLTFSLFSLLSDFTCKAH